MALPHSLQQPPHLVGLGTLQTIESSAALHARRMIGFVLMSGEFTAERSVLHYRLAFAGRKPSRSLTVRLLSAAALILPIGTGVL